MRRLIYHNTGIASQVLQWPIPCNSSLLHSKIGMFLFLHFLYKYVISTKQLLN